jgi:hypothetical protein
MDAEKQRLTFISYSRADKDFALELAKELRSSGFLIWFDQLDIPTGSRWDDEVEKALENCEIFMVILTPDSMASDNVKDEIGYAIDGKKRILPVLLKNANVPFRLRRFQYVDFTKLSYDEGIDLSKQLLREFLNEPTEESPAVSTEGAKRIPKPIKKWWKKPKMVAIIMTVVIILSVIIFSGFFNNRIFPTKTPMPTVITETTFTPTAACRPQGNQPPSINLSFVPRSVKVNKTIDLIIIISDPENDPYEITAITTEKGQVSDEKKPYQYTAPDSPGEDVLKIYVRDYNCTTMEEIKIVIQQ